MFHPRGAFPWESSPPLVFFSPQNGGVSWSEDGDGCRGREISRDFAKVGTGALGRGNLGIQSPAWRGFVPFGAGLVPGTGIEFELTTGL